MDKFIYDENRNKVKCIHFNDCNEYAVYKLYLTDGSIGYVCESCDEDYSACLVCRNGDLRDEMFFVSQEDERPTCVHCRDKEAILFFNQGTVRIKELQGFLKDYYPDDDDDMPWESLGYQMIEPNGFTGKNFGEMDQNESVTFVELTA